MAPQEKGKAEQLATEIANIGAMIYAKMIDAEIPPGKRTANRPKHFTAAQAFELTQTLLYEAVNAEGLI